MEMNSPLRVVTLTLYGEARGQKVEDQLGVLAVIRERVLRPGWWGTDWESVVTHPWQFTSWHEPDEVHKRNHLAMLQAEQNEPDLWKSLSLLVEKAFQMQDSDVMELFEVEGPDDFPTHYHDHSQSRAPPQWGSVREIQPRWEGSAFRWYVVEQGRPPRKGNGDVPAG